MIKQQEWTKIYNLFRVGLSVPKIAQRVGRSCPTIYRLIENGGPKHRHRKTKRSHKEITNYKRSIRFETEPGEQAQVDWGSFGKVTIKGRVNRLYCFVYVLGYSRSMYIEFVVKQCLPVFEQCHINAFEKLGIPKTILYDNIKTVVLNKEKLPSGEKKIHYNPAFLDFTRYYGFEAKLCPPYWPRTKGKVEAGIKYVRNSFMPSITFKKSFSSLKELNEKASQWVSKVANLREHRTTGEKPINRWLKEKSHLQILKNFPPYPVLPFIERASTKDGMIQYKTNFYSVPIQFARRKLLIKEGSKNGVNFIEMYHEDNLITQHDLSQGRGNWIIKDCHLEKNSFNNKTRKTLKKLIRKTLSKPLSEISSRSLSYYDNLLLKSNHG